MRMTFIIAALACAALWHNDAVAAGKFDGVYEGEGTLRTGRCARPEGPRYRVVDSHIAHPMGGGGAVVDADVAANGTLSNGPGAVRTTTTGTISGSTLSMDITTAYCTFHYELTKKG